MDVSNVFVDEGRGVVDGGSHVCRLVQLVDALQALQEIDSSFHPIHLSFYQTGEIENIPIKSCNVIPDLSSEPNSTLNNLGDESAANEMGMSYQDISNANGVGILRTGGSEIDFKGALENPMWNCLTDCLCSGQVCLRLNDEWVKIRPMIDFDVR